MTERGNKPNETEMFAFRMRRNEHFGGRGCADATLFPKDELGKRRSVRDIKIPSEIKERIRKLAG